MEDTVLLVDDDQNVLSGLARALRHQPYQLYTAASGEEALLILKTRRLDVIVTDEQMPGMSGGDLRAWVAEHCPDVTRIVLTGRPSVETAIRAINEGAVYQFFTKPCNPARLAVAIRKALEHKALRTANRQLLDVNRRNMQDLEHFSQNLEALTSLVCKNVKEPLQVVACSKESRDGQCGDIFDSKARRSVDHALDGVAKVQCLVDGLLEHCRAKRAANPAYQSDTK